MQGCTLFTLVSAVCYVIQTTQHNVTSPHVHEQHLRRVNSESAHTVVSSLWTECTQPSSADVDRPFRYHVHNTLVVISDLGKVTVGELIRYIVRKLRTSATDHPTSE